MLWGLLLHLPASVLGELLLLPLTPMKEGFGTPTDTNPAGGLLLLPITKILGELYHSLWQQYLLFAPAPMLGGLLLLTLIPILGGAF